MITGDTKENKRVETSDCRLEKPHQRGFDL